MSLFNPLEFNTVISPCVRANPINKDDLTGEEISFFDFTMDRSLRG